MQVEREKSIIVRYIPEYIMVETQIQPQTHTQYQSFDFKEQIHNYTLRTPSIDNLQYDYDAERCLQDITFEPIDGIEYSTGDNRIDDHDDCVALDIQKFEFNDSDLVDTTAELPKETYDSNTSHLLTEWFFSNLHSPYPTEEEKESLMVQTNMNKIQINNWFINKRKRNKHLFDGRKKTLIDSEPEIDQENQPSDDVMIDDLQSTTVKLQVIIQPDSARKHQQKKVTNIPDDLPSICDVCGKKFAHRYMLQSHLKRHDPSKWDKCEICEKSFPDGLKRHMRVHSGERPYVCEECGASYKQAYGLTMHKAVHDNSGELFYCDTCNNGKAYRTKYALKDHFKIHYRMRSDNSTVPASKVTCKPPKICTICGFETYNMRSHHIARHSTLRPFKCETCTETFKFKKDLQTHYAYHSNAMNFECDECEKRFKTKRKMVIHKRIHSSEKLYQCTLCDKSFLVSTYLTKHMRLHNGEKKRHACTECSKDYSGITDLRRHLQREHGIKIEPNPKYSNNNMTKKYKVS